MQGKFLVTLCAVELSG